ADALEFRPAVIVSGASPAAERAWLMSARTCAAALPEVVPAGLVADAAGEGDAGRADVDADADGDGAGRWCLVRAADGLGESEAAGPAGAAGRTAGRRAVSERRAIARGRVISRRQAKAGLAAGGKAVAGRLVWRMGAVPGGAMACGGSGRHVKRPSRRACRTA